MRRLLAVAVLAIACLAATAAPAVARPPEPTRVEASRPAAADVSRRLEHLRLQCRLATIDGQRGIACAWSAAQHPAAVAYKLLRSVDGGQREVVFRGPVREGRRRFLDTDVAAGHHYVYAVEAVNADGRVVSISHPVRVDIPAADRA